LPLDTVFNPVFSIAPVVLALTGIFIAFAMYKKPSDAPQKVSNGLRGLYGAAYHKFYIDELYIFVTKKVVFNLVGRPAAWIDRNIVDGFMNLLAVIAEFLALIIRPFQSGRMQQYAVLFFTGVLAFILIFIFWWN